MEARIYIYSSNRNRGVVYFDQHLGAVHPKTLVEIVIFSVFMKKMDPYLIRSCFLQILVNGNIFIQF